MPRIRQKITFGLELEATHLSGSAIQLSANRGFELRREGDKVSHLINGKKERTYTLLDRK